MTKKNIRVMRKSYHKATIFGTATIALTVGVLAAMSWSGAANGGQAILANHAGIDKIYDHPYGDLDEFRTAELSPYNDAIRDAFFLEYDFEADFHPDTEKVVGHVVALMVHKEKHDGTYNPTEAERRYHEFIMRHEDDNINKPDIPNTADEVDAALIAILGHENHMYRAHELYESFNNKANIGNVHTDLFFSDTDFWGVLWTIAMCEHETPDEGCDELAASIALNRELTPEEIEEIEKRIPADPDFSLAPKAYAAYSVSKPVTTYIRVTASNCAGYEPCSKVASSSGPSNQEAETTQSTHVYSKNEDGEWIEVDLTYYGSGATRDSPDALSQYIWAKGKFTSPHSPPSPVTGHGTTFAEAEDDWTPDGRDYVFHAQVRSGAWAWYN